jgi:hypothetical protein
MIALLLFIVLNSCLFLPRYYFNKNNSSFFPISELFEQKKLNLKKLINRFNDDIFRFNFEFIIVILLLILFKENIPISLAIVLVSVFYLLTLVLFFYHYSIYSIYKTYPTISSDWKLITQGIQIAKNGYLTQLLLGLTFFISFIIGLFYLIYFLIEAVYNSSNNSLLIFCLGLLVITFVFSVYKRTNPFQFTKEFDFNFMSFFVIQFSALLLQSNTFFSKKTKLELSQLPEIIAKKMFKFPKGISFKSKPNIYFIAIESYGAILYEDKNYHEKYSSLLNSITQNLHSNDCHIASSLSESPVSGGGSWIAYSSFLMGINITSDLIYRKLFNERHTYPTQSMLAILAEIGYETSLIATIGGFENFTIEWEKTLSLLGAKNVIRFDDLNYTGEKFNFGPSAPDQYMLQKSRVLLKGKNPNQPISFFVETINSHANFESPTLLISNWEDCKTANREMFKPTQDLDKKIKENYFSAIEYQLKTLEDFILTEKEEAIFVLFGDHQPPLISTKNNSFKTPIHIISKNKLFIEKWYSQGFDSSLEIKSLENNLKHEDLKSLFLENFFASYQK